MQNSPGFSSKTGIFAQRARVDQAVGLDESVEGNSHSSDLNVERRWQLEVALIREC